jgi:hypothetical protein
VKCNVPKQKWKRKLSVELQNEILYSWSVISQIQTEMDHLKRETQKCKILWMVYAPKHLFLQIFHQHIQSLRYKVFNFKILLHINLSTIGVLGLKLYRLFEDQIICYILPHFSLVSIHNRKQKVWWFIYVCVCVCTIQYISQNSNKLRVFQSQRTFPISIVKTVHFKIIIIFI